MNFQLNFAKLKEIQERLRKRVVIGEYEGKIELVAGMDCAFEGEKIFGAITVMRFPELEKVEEKFEVMKNSFPYVPGFLSFREAPVLIRAFRKLEKKPDILLIDGQGTLHPRNFGIACHIGVILGKPSIGCAKKRLCGKFLPPGIEKGDRSPVLLKGSIQGYSLRTRSKVKPVFISPGNFFAYQQACEIVLKMSKFRLPEPLRQADKFSKECRKTSKAGNVFRENPEQ